MLVLRKKQIAMATLCMCLSIFTFMFTTAKQETEETVVLPVSRKDYNFRCWAWCTG